MKVSLFLIIFSLVLMASCQQDIQIKTANVSGPALIWNYNSPILRSGESVPFAFTNGVPAYTTNANGVGTFDSTTLVYSTAINQAPINHTISARDSEGKRGTNALKIAGFQNGNRVGFPDTFGDQVFPTSAVTAANGSIYVANIISDSPGWERWQVQKSIDVGVTWTEVDHWAPNEEGESHPLSMATKVNDVYVCGYVWISGSPVYSSEWVVRKTSNGGTTWSIVDRYGSAPGTNNVCYDIDVHSASGGVFAAGYDGNGGLVRLSEDDGASWDIIGTFPTETYLNTVKVSPAGVVWVVGQSGHTYKGTFAGVWNWTDMGPSFGGALATTIYELAGDLEVVSETEAYFSGFQGAYQIFRTTDGGTTWNSVYSPGASYAGQQIKKLSSGDFVAVGSQLVGMVNSFVVYQSPDGITWSVTENDNASTRQGISLTEANDGSVLAFGYLRSNPSQAFVKRSTDDGLTWTFREYIYFRQQLYTYLQDFHKDASGNLWATAGTTYLVMGEGSAWVTVKSTDNGATWSQSDVFTSAVDDYYTGRIGTGPANQVYVTGWADGSGTILRRSPDGGATWTTVDSVVPTISGDRVAVASDGTAYFIGGNVGGCQLRVGTANGTVWNNGQLFPFLPGYTGCQSNALEVFSDDSIWFNTSEVTGVIGETAIYRSTDQGATFSEILRMTETVYVASMIERPNGDKVVNTQYKVMKTSDNGVTWQDLYDGTATTSEVTGFMFDSVGRLYVQNYDKVLAQNQFDGTWFTMMDYTLMNLFYGAEITMLADCGASSGVCAVVHYEKTIDGGINQLVPLVVP